MKHLCYSKYIFLLFIVNITLSASLLDKSALFYYGDKISYSMVGVHDYIVVEPENTNVYTHGFSVYKHKIFARVIISNSIEETKKRIKKLLKQGYKGIYLDKNESSKKSKKLINYFKSVSPEVNFIVKYDERLEEELYELFDAIVIDDTHEIKVKHIKTIQKSGVDIIKIHFVTSKELDDVQEYIQKIQSQDMVPYVTTRTFNRYGKSSKNAIKREIFTLIDESKEDRTLIGAHQIGAMPMEYLGYIQKLYDISAGLPELEDMHHYAGVAVWLHKDYKNPQKLMQWILSMHKIGIKVVFMNSFGFSIDSGSMKALDIDIYDGDSSVKNKKQIIYQDKMIGFEMDPSLGENTIYMHPNHARELLVFEDSHGLRSTPVAITSWGGYAIGQGMLVELKDENVWVVNPFDFLQEALRLPIIAVPDTTTHNGKRIFFTHIDGDGMVSRVESNPELFSGDMILDKILKAYDVPHSVSLIGAEVEPTGLYPKFSSRVLGISKEMYALENVEAATHTFTHPFYWGEIKNGKLAPEFRLQPKDYEFSLDREFLGTLEFITNNLLNKDERKRAVSVFWSGDCTPRFNALEYIYQHNLLNINGGYTTINNIAPWLTLVAPIGLERNEYYQIYTGAQNENVFTNDWLGPFWGFKRVVQTFKLTDSPRRLKPIDIYYHLYSGTKTASLNALKYIFNWSLKQEIFPIFTSEYIPKAMDYFIVSMANEENRWLVSGMKSLKTLRFEDFNKSIDITKSNSVYGFRNFENHTYISFDKKQEHNFTVIKEKPSVAYLIASNAEVIKYNRGQTHTQYSFKGYTSLTLDFYLPGSCKLLSTPKASSSVYQNENIHLEYLKSKEAIVNVICR
ncbi:hypothetical protein JHD46_01870 [Sulfurimonas sp. SAG-AH-194-C20]|nr:hypothetical protein [Sulfurimonas sp. SAG-AH-194-C20]MDF1878382.1 hypothetical protein [Sulfurimonas sp. SAG-AH-194-C20]